MGQDFIEELLSNVTNEKAVSDGLNKLIEANKIAYQEAIDSLQEQSLSPLPSEDKDIAPNQSKLELLLQHISSGHQG